MSVNAGSLFQSPTGKAPEHLYLSLRTLIDTLNRLQQADTSDLSTLLEEIDEAKAEIEDLVTELEGLAGEIGTIAANPMLSPQKLFELSLVTQIDTYLGSVSNLVKDTIKRSEQAADTAIKNVIAGLQNKASINVEQVVRKSENESFVRQLTTFDASLGNTQAALSDEITARATGDSANASSISSLTTTVNGNTAQILIVAESVDGIEQKFAVTLNENGQVTGLIQLDGTPTGSNFTVVADKLMVAYPGINGGDPIPILTLEEIDEETVLALNGTLVTNALTTYEMTAVFAHLGSGYVDGILQSDPENENGNLKLDFDNIEFELTTADEET